MLCPTCRFPIKQHAGTCSKCGADLAALWSQPTVAQDVVGDDEPTAEGHGRPALAGRYDILEQLGKGAFGEVYLGHDRRLDKDVAIKRMARSKLEGRISSLLLRRFRDEARAIAKLDHPNIVKVYDYTEQDDAVFIIMDYVDGRSLDEYLKERGSLPVAEAVELFRGVAEGLFHAHKRNLIHRDIKPSNIMLAREGDRLTPRLVDFGLARVPSAEHLSQTGVAVGTPVYMPPEQRRDAKNVNHTADIYSLGKVLYVMVTGEVPDNIDPSLIPQPAGLVKIIFKCVRTRPDDRYFSVRELLADLDKLGTEPATEVPPHQRIQENRCPECRLPNERDDRFCASCGAPLTRVCPECDSENTIHRTICGKCGIDMDAFEQVEESVRLMRDFVATRRWRQILRECELLPADLRLHGPKGQELVGAVAGLKGQADEALAAAAETRHRAETEAESERYESAAKLYEDVSQLDPEDSSSETRAEELRYLDLHKKLAIGVERIGEFRAQGLLGSAHEQLDRLGEVLAGYQLPASATWKAEYDELAAGLLAHRRQLADLEAAAAEHQRLGELAFERQEYDVARDRLAAALSLNSELEHCVVLHRQADDLARAVAAKWKECQEWAAARKWKRSELCCDDLLELQVRHREARLLRTRVRRHRHRRRVFVLALMLVVCCAATGVVVTHPSLQYPQILQPLVRWQVQRGLRQASDAIAAGDYAAALAAFDVCTREGVGDYLTAAEGAQLQRLVKAADGLAFGAIVALERQAAALPDPQVEECRRGGRALANARQAFDVGQYLVALDQLQTARRVFVDLIEDERQGRRELREAKRAFTDRAGQEDLTLVRSFAPESWERIRALQARAETAEDFRVAAGHYRSAMEALEEARPRAEALRSYAALVAKARDAAAEALEETDGEAAVKRCQEAFAALDSGVREGPLVGHLSASQQAQAETLLSGLRAALERLVGEMVEQAMARGRALADAGRYAEALQTLSAPLADDDLRAYVAAAQGKTLDALVRSTQEAYSTKLFEPARRRLREARAQPQPASGAVGRAAAELAEGEAAFARGDYQDAETRVAAVGAALERAKLAAATEQAGRLAAARHAFLESKAAHRELLAKLAPDETALLRESEALAGRAEAQGDPEAVLRAYAEAADQVRRLAAVARYREARREMQTLTTEDRLQRLKAYAPESLGEAQTLRQQAEGYAAAGEWQAAAEAYARATAALRQADQQAAGRRDADDALNASRAAAAAAAKALAAGDLDRAADYCGTGETQLARLTAVLAALPAERREAYGEVHQALAECRGGLAAVTTAVGDAERAVAQAEADAAAKRVPSGAALGALAAIAAAGDRFPQNRARALMERVYHVQLNYVCKAAPGPAAVPVAVVRGWVSRAVEDLGWDVPRLAQEFGLAIGQAMVPVAAGMTFAAEPPAGPAGHWYRVFPERITVNVTPGAGANAAVAVTLVLVPPAEAGAGSAFYVTRYPVLNRDVENFWRLTDFPDLAEPVTSLNCVMAMRFANWLSRQLGVPTSDLAYRCRVSPGDSAPGDWTWQAASPALRLPTTAEWARACSPEPGASPKPFRRLSETGDPNRFGVSLLSSDYATWAAPVSSGAAAEWRRRCPLPGQGVDRGTTFRLVLPLAVELPGAR